MTLEELNNVQGRAWEDVDVSNFLIGEPWNVMVIARLTPFAALKDAVRYVDSDVACPVLHKRGKVKVDDQYQPALLADQSCVEVRCILRQPVREIRMTGGCRSLGISRSSYSHLSNAECFHPVMYFTIS